VGLLDDLKSQAEQKNKPTDEQLTPAGAEEFYRAHIKQRMLMAYDFFTQLVNQLNEMKLVIRAEYPFKPEGKNVTLLQQGYKAYSDHITDPRQITFSLTCTLANPATYDVSGRGPALAQGELLERFQFKYEKLEARDQNQMVIGARFKLQGPLQVKCVLQFDEAKQIIKLLLTNFVGPGTSQYNLKPEQLDEAFMDHLGKYLLRKEANLFQEEISDDVKAMLRKKLEQEQMQREAELQAVEEQRKAEEEARKQNSATEQLKKAVSQSVNENKEKLKKAVSEKVYVKKDQLISMFNKLKKQAGFESDPQQTPAAPAQTSSVTRQNPVPPKPNISQAARPTGNPAIQTASAQARSVPAAQKVVNSTQTNAAQTTPAQQNPVARPTPPAQQKKPAPPKVFQASSSNPFLKPADFEPVTADKDEQTAAKDDAKIPTEQAPTETTKPAVAKTPNPFLQTKASTAVAEKNTTVQSPADKAKPATVTTPKPTVLPAAGQAKSTNESKSSEIPKPTMATTPKPTVSPAMVQAKSTDKPNASAETPKPAPATIPSQTVSPAASQAKSTDESNTSAAMTPNPLKQPKAPAAPTGSGLSLEPVASDSESSSAATRTEPESEPSSEVSSLSPEKAPAAPVESGLSLEAIASDSESSSPVTKTEPESVPSSEVSSLSLEDELGRDLEKLMEDAQQKPPVESETVVNPSLSDGKPDFDLSSPDALEIHFEDMDEVADQDNSEPKK